MTTPSDHRPHTGAWVAFTYASFVASLGMMGLGILLLPVDLAVRGYLAMGTAMLVQSSLILAKTLRDAHEGSRLHKRIEDARVEELLARAERG
jgi:hypothetical protein